MEPKVGHLVHICPPLDPILSQVNPTTSSHPTSMRLILILSSDLHLGLPSGLSLPPSGFADKTLYQFLISPMRATCPAISSFSSA
jgi:hypothetical protein